MKNRYPLSCIDDLFDQFSGASCFSKIDLRSVYHQVMVREEDVEKIGFQSCYGHYEFVVMPLGFTKALIVFMDLMNQVCRTMLNRSVIVFIDDILVYCNTREQHGEHIRELLGVFWRERIYAKFFKCKFWLR